MDSRQSKDFLTNPRFKHSKGLPQEEAGAKITDMRTQVSHAAVFRARPF
jgi:hypothetical protein